MDAKDGASMSVDSVSFSFLTDEEVRKQSFVKITNPVLLDGMGIPNSDGLYDLLLGTLNENKTCQTCGPLLHRKCPGHCGHIDLIYPVYNPILFDLLHKLLQRTCFYCKKFRVAAKVDKVASQLELIAKGDIFGAKRLDLPSENIEGTYESCPTVHSAAQDHNGEPMKPQEWTALQFAEATSVLNRFLRLQSKKCTRCKKESPTISKPTFGWFYLSNLSNEAMRSNALMGAHCEGLAPDESEGMTSAEDSSAPPGKKGRAKKKNENKWKKVSYEFQKQKNSTPFIPTKVKSFLECLWEEEARLCSFISDIQQQQFRRKEGGHSMFFLQTILVPPIKFRPPSKGGDSVMEHPQTVLLSKVLQCNISLGDALKNDSSKIPSRWLDLQQSINVLFDGRYGKGPGQREVSSGIIQILEKKEGLFRQKMMGKRVNYACRSVISPDPYLGVNEIGIPPCFAIKLTYPERVTPWNAAKLRNSVINGSDCHPGATKYVDKLSSNILPASRKTRISISRKLSSSRGAVMQPGKSPDYEEEGKVVYRHMQDGDVVLVNRQPTLHKPSIMAHVVRVLKGEKTLRMHYANCSTYNADFDGDEMNVHFPQDEVSRAEAYNIVNANNQYVRPSNGEPIRSLIQDHIVSAALLTKKDTFLTRDEVEQLLYCSGVTVGSATTFSGKSGQKVLVSCSEDDINAIQPVILKPVYRWSGKQVITALLNHITRGHPPFSVEKGGKIPFDFFKSRINKGEPVHETTDQDKFSKRLKSNKAVTTRKKDLSDDKMLIRGNDLLCGVIDKAQFGEYGLVHTVQELYGSNTAGFLLSVMSRLFTAYLQMHGFTCGVDDLLITETKDDQRKKQLESCEKSGELIHRNFIGIKDENIKIDPVELQLNIEKTIRSDGESALTYLDRQMTNELNSKTSTGVINELLSEGLLKPSGRNCISLMTTSGAKGSKVNFQQISSFLGQQELEGKRVPRMVSGKTLPCFHPWDWAARAGGYIIDRFLTGLRPQEYYFHCMAGREGLVDTAVKTSRSGYLQRCLIKNLECLKISYDYTVRDADGSIVQFCYGEDGVDVHQISFIEKFDALTLNQEIVKRRSDHKLGVFNSYISEVPVALMGKAEKFLKDGKMEHKMTDLQELVKQKYIKSLAQPGEPVGVLAAQSVGEPSTQMTLNTFHLAGRGEMNVTLGIPRLQEILMTASNDIKTPIMTCPLKEGSRKEDAVRLSDKLKKVTVADIIESMEVSIMPFAVHNNDICRIYKLKMHLHRPAHYPQYTDISVSDWAGTLEVVFVRALEDAIQNHVALLNRMSGIKNLESETRTKTPNERDEDAAGTMSRGEETEDDLDDGEGVDDLGLDAQKRKGQATDDVNYEDCEEENQDEGKSSGFGSEEEMGDDETQISKDDIVENEIPVSPSQVGSPSNKRSRSTMPESPSQAGTNTKAKSSNDEKSEAKKKKRVREKLRKDFDREIYVKSTKSNQKLLFEVHFKFTAEPHILLAEIAQKTAKKVYIQNPGMIEQCRVTDCKENQVIYFGKNPTEVRENYSPERKQSIPALSTSGVDFKAFWRMQDVLDCRYVYSNSIHAMLESYGVEAARETVIREIMHVFGSYGISVNIRHLSLIADYMTFSGGYRPMSRLGGIAESSSPFSKMCFETASNFIFQAALHGAVDNLESPSARIILGLPVKMGTGSFDLMQQLEL